MTLVAGRLRALATSVGAVVAAGCVVAMGAGAAGGIYYTKRGAETTIAAPIGRVFDASQRAFAEMGLRDTEAELDREDDDEAEGQLEGKRGDLKVKVTLKAKGRGPTRVRVVAKRDDFGWDKRFARDVLERIVLFAH